MTLEDPIEYCLDGITQAHINPSTGLTFEKGMRSLVRQDPDVIMIGEIRDKITARISIEAALTGHLVLSTLHTANAPSAIMRLMDMAVEPFLINAALSGVLAQRLVRMLCNHCKEPYHVLPQERFIIEKLCIPESSLCVSRGCVMCDGLGYKGRIGIFELLEISPALKALIVQNPQFDEIYKQALADGMVTLEQDAAQKVSQGIISLQELIRVIL
jgi:type II secretory ATPase GspE/PulE/Tfp pilus assembly ATPase PilB-like protein